MAARGRILIGFAEALAAVEVAWSLVDAGFEVVAFGRRQSHATLRRWPAVPVADVTPPERDVARSLADLEHLLDRAGADALIPLDDAAVWLCDRLAQSRQVTVVGATGPQALLALDKRLQLGAAADAGYEVVPSRTFASSAEPLRARLDYPLVVKPARAMASWEGRLRRGGPIRVCADEQELRSAAPEFLPGEPVLVQPLLRGAGEGLFGLARSDEVLRWSAHRRIRLMHPAGSGSSACRSIVADPELTAIGERMIVASGWRGMFMIELIRAPDGRALFMELNGRAWGSMALARRMGFEYPAWAALQKLDGSFTPPVPAARAAATCRHLGRELIHLLIALRGPTSSALDDWPSRLQAVRGVLRFGRGDDWYNLRPDSRRLFVYDTASTVWDEVSGTG